MHDHLLNPCVSPDELSESETMMQRYLSVIPINRLRLELALRSKSGMDQDLVRRQWAKRAKKSRLKKRRRALGLFDVRVHDMLCIKINKRDEDKVLRALKALLKENRHKGLSWVVAEALLFYVERRKRVRAT